MENTLAIKKDYNSLDSLLEFLKKETSFECFKEYDHWELRTSSSGQMEQCIVVKKSALHAVKIYFTAENMIKVSYVIPNKLMHAYFGKSVKAYRNIFEIILGKLKEILLATPQKIAYLELEEAVRKAA